MIFFYLLVSIMPLVNHPLWSHFVGDLTMTKFVGIACLIYAVGYRAVRRSFPPIGRSWVLRLFMLFFFMVTVSYFWKSFGKAWNVTPLMTYTSFLFMFFVTIAVVDSLSRLRWTLFVAIGSLAFASLYVIREWQEYHNIYPAFRPGWITGDPNYFTLSAVVCLPIAYYMMVEEKSRWSKLFCFSCLTVTMVAVMLAASRGGFFGLVISLVVIIWRSPRRLRNVAVIAAFLTPLMIFAPSGPVQRLLHPDYGDEAGTDTRLELWQAGLQMIKQNPLTGVGVGNFKSLVTGYEDPDESLQKIAHNTYIEVAAEMGIPALLVFLGILISVYRALARVRASTAIPPFLHSAADALQVGLMGSAVSITFISCESQKLLWFLVFLAPCLELLAHNLEAQAEQNPQLQTELEEDVAMDGDTLPDFDEVPEVPEVEVAPWQ